MNKSILHLTMMLLLPVCLIGCGQGGEAYKDSLLGKASKITVYQEGKAYPVPSDEPIYGTIVETAGEALLEVNDIYKGIDETSNYTNAGQTLVIELSEAKPLSLGNQSGDTIPVRHIVVPLSGKSYKEDQLIMAGNNDQFLNMFETDKSSLKDLHELAEKALSTSK